VHLADVEGPAVLGRDLDLAADLGHVPSLIGLFAGAASLWQVAARRDRGNPSAARRHRTHRRQLEGDRTRLERIAPRLRLAPLGLAAFGLVLVMTTDDSRLVSLGTVASMDRQATTVADAWRLAHGDRAGFLARLGPPPAAQRDLARLGGATSI
jgi:hypothetical protein